MKSSMRSSVSEAFTIRRICGGPETIALEMAGPVSRIRCAVCSHSERAAIDIAIGSRSSARAIEAQFQVNRRAVQRHMAMCFTAAIARSNTERIEKLDTDSIVEEMLKLVKRGVRLLDDADTSGTLSERGKAMREARENLIALGRLTGAIAGPSTTIDARTLSVNINAMKDLSIDELRRIAAAVPK